MKSNDGRLKSVKQSELLPFVFGLVVFFMASVQLEAQESTTEDDSTEQEALFENKIRPLLAQKCAECHGAENRKVIFESITERPFLQVERLARNPLFQVSLLRVS